SLRTASSTIKGMETIRGIYKKNRRNGTLCSDPQNIDFSNLYFGGHYNLEEVLSLFLFSFKF
ncbi:hypothetical protein EFK49_12515, partial [Lactococcus lactis subsp. lactis]|nr:hypothetical protein [Lactococcus lactis subsp. lactis]